MGRVEQAELFLFKRKEGCFFAKKRMLSVDPEHQFWLMADFLIWMDLYNTTNMRIYIPKESDIHI